MSFPWSAVVVGAVLGITVGAFFKHKIRKAVKEARDRDIEFGKACPHCTEATEKLVTAKRIKPAELILRLDFKDKEQGLPDDKLVMKRLETLYGAIESSINSVDTWEVFINSPFWSVHPDFYKPEYFLKGLRITACLNCGTCCGWWGFSKDVQDPVKLLQELLDGFIYYLEVKEMCASSEEGRKHSERVALEKQAADICGCGEV